MLTDAPISFGLIQKEHWSQPDWIDEDRARRGRLDLMSQGIIYAGQFEPLPIAFDINQSFDLQTVCRTCLVHLRRTGVS